MPLDRFGVSRPWYVVVPTLPGAVGFFFLSLVTSVQLLSSHHRLPGWWVYTVAAGCAGMALFAVISVFWHVRRRLRIRREIREEAEAAQRT